MQKPISELFFLRHHQMWLKSCGTGGHTDTFTLSSSFNADAEIDPIGHQISVATDPSSPNKL